MLIVFCDGGLTCLDLALNLRIFNDELESPSPGHFPKLMLKDAAPMFLCFHGATVLWTSPVSQRHAMQYHQTCDRCRSQSWSALLINLTIEMTPWLMHLSYSDCVAQFEGLQGLQ